MRLTKHLTLFLVILLSACSQESKQRNESEIKESVEKKLIEITVKAIGENMAEIAFEPKTLSIPENSKVILTFENQSSSVGMLHNFVLIELGSGAEIAKTGIKAGKKNEFVPKDQRVITFTKVAELGEIIKIEFDAPSKGSYHYICTFPGHYPSMIGRLNVE